MIAPSMMFAVPVIEVLTAALRRAAQVLGGHVERLDGVTRPKAHRPVQYF